MQGEEISRFWNESDITFMTGTKFITHLQGLCSEWPILIRHGHLMTFKFDDSHFEISLPHVKVFTH